MRKLMLIAALLSILTITAKKEEKAYYGTNYTVPFAHAYRALHTLGIDPKDAIDRDVYHFSRLGLDAFRLHLWDVELSDSIGNLLDNDHLNLLDYLIAALEKRGISIIITAQTNFGNGYPERNTDPNGAYSYRYDKCSVHDDPAAQDAQARYLASLVRHVNPYTGRSYAADPAILAIEINNEPCHSGTEEQITQYIDRMVQVLKDNGWKKDVLYNVSHNLDRTQAFYNANIDGTTYQWYPLNLVSGHTRQGNFLPYVDDYYIPFKDMDGFDKKSRIVYEYDPADNLLSYIFPAAARTFRKEGFWWVTQFAYDPMDIAWANTEYQTHYLNLAYTPGKAIGMMIAAEVMRQTPAGADYGKYPADTVFGNFTVSAKRDLAMLNDGKRYYYTNSNDIAPVNPQALQHIAGCGTSPVVGYDGSGAYFIDRIGKDLWRVEVMPDIVLTSDPFERPSLSKRVGEIIYSAYPMRLELPGLDSRFAVRRIDGPTFMSSQLSVTPGVYIVGVDSAAVAAIDPAATYADGYRSIGEYAAPLPYTVSDALVHTPLRASIKADGLQISAIAVGNTKPDSIVVFPSTVSVWSSHNNLYPMHPTGKPYEYNVTIPQSTRGMPYKLDKSQKPDKSQGERFDDNFSYNIVVYREGSATTYPGGIPGSPLDWDYLPGSPRYYTTCMLDYNDDIMLLEASPDLNGSEVSTIPTDWHGVSWKYCHTPGMPDRMTATKGEGNDADVVITKYVGDLANVLKHLGDRTEDVYIEVMGEADAPVDICVVTSDGFTYGATVSLDGSAVRVQLSDFGLRPTPLCPEPYPAFMLREFVPDPSTAIPLRPDAIERVILRTSGKQLAVSYLDISR